MILTDEERSPHLTTEAPPLRVRPLYTPPPVTPYSKLGAEGRPWWAPAGRLLVAVTSPVSYAVLLVLSPLLLAVIAGRRIRRRTLTYRRSPADLRVLLRLTGRAAWYCPRWARRVLPNIAFGHG